MSDSPVPSAKPPLSPRRRRLRNTAAALSTLALLGLAIGLAVHFVFRTKPYAPGEVSSDVTAGLTLNLSSDAPKPRFKDVTRESGLASFRNFIGDRTSQLPEDMGPGLAWGDFNNDGYDDVFLVSAGGSLETPAEKLAPCELYENLGDGTFRKVESFPETRIHGMGAAWADYDGDGFLDLIVTGYNSLLLFHNEHGSGRFVRDERFANRKGFWAGAAWGDYDNDRAPDLYVCGYVQYIENASDRARVSQQVGTAVPYTLNPAAYQPGTNLLFHNNGDGTFTEVAGPLGVSDPQGRSLGALWHDFDDDGWLDLYVANDVSDNVFYRNLSGKFEDLSHPACVADYRSAMGLAVGDFDRDGDDDLYITHWVAQENALYENLWADFNSTNRTPEEVGRGVPTAPPATHASPSNQPPRYPLRFMDIADMKGLGQIAIPFVGWGTEFVDFDGDGWLDLVSVNGSTLEIEGPPPRKMQPQEPFLFWNRRGEFFFNLAPGCKPLSEKHLSRGLAVADYDNDGAMDVLIAQLGEGVQLLRNEMQTGNWLKVRLHSQLRNGAPLGFGDGARLIAHVGGVSLRRAVTSASYLSQSSRTVHFGLAQARQVDRLEVRWLGGATNYFENLEANTIWELTEGEPVATRAPAGLKISPARSGSSGGAASAGTKVGESGGLPPDKARQLDFWTKQRAAMNALKIDKDPAKAVPLFRAALEINPEHEDSLYYLGQCLAVQGSIPEALDQLEKLNRVNPQSHRAFQQWGTLRALHAASKSDLDLAEESLDRARALNPEETGALVVLGEVALLRGDLASAEKRLSDACRSNPRAVDAYFLRGYMAWTRGDKGVAADFLKQTRAALGKDWQPRGSTSEGDVKQKQQQIGGTVSGAFRENWDGTEDADRAYAALDRFLKNKNWH
jgi:tetratricopeptide (TPR) repeat protein